MADDEVIVGLHGKCLCILRGEPVLLLRSFAECDLLHSNESEFECRVIRPGASCCC